MRAGSRALRALGASSLLVILSAAAVGAHAFPERSEPRVGAVVHSPPAQVRIWFDGDLESAFSRIAVTDASGKPVDRGDSHVASQNRRVLQVSLPPLAAGRYTVRWSVLAVDGHRTEGDYTFTLKGSD